MFRRFTIWIIVLGSFLTQACARKAAPRPDGDGPRRVEVVKAERRRIPRTVVAVGTLAAEERAELGFKVPGRLAQWNVDLGSRVTERASLAELDARDYELRRDRSRAALEQARSRLGLAGGGDDDDVESQKVGIVRQAKARLDQATINLNRSRELRDQGILAQADFDATDASFKVAQSLYNDSLEEVNNRRGILAERRSDLALAEQQLLDTKLRAPFSGAVQQRRANLGEYLAAGAPVLILVKLTPLRLRLDVPEREASNVRKGQEVAVRGWVEGSGTDIAEAEVDNTKGLLRPGSFARAEIVTDSGQDSLVVPGSSVLVFAGIEKVITVKEGKALEQPITTGRRTGESVEVLSGLTEGEPVVVKPGSLQTGVAVEISSGPPPAP